MRLAKLAVTGLWVVMWAEACGGDGGANDGTGTGGGATLGGSANDGTGTGGGATLGGSASGGAGIGVSPSGGAPAGGATIASGGSGIVGANNATGGAGTGGADGTEIGGANNATGGAGIGGASSGTGGVGTGGANDATGGAGIGGASSGTGGAGTGGANDATGGAGIGGASGGAGGTESGGANDGTGGAGIGGASSGAGGTETEGANDGTGGAGIGGANDATGGSGSGGVNGGMGGTETSDPCTVGAWPTADPTQPGPFEITTETNIGPTSSDGTRFTLVRPTDLAETSLCHPIVTWGNGSGSSTTFYTKLLNQLASHGFVVIASDSGNVQQGNPYFQVAGAQWVIDQNDDPSSTLYQRIDPNSVGATGHSLGGYATSEVGRDSRITTTAPACGAIGSNQMKGPTLILCGGNDPFVPCDDDPVSAFNGTSGVPVMLANSHGADHANWFSGQSLSDMEIAITAWMRVQLMDDSSLRNWFYGASCELCQDSDWTVQQKMMD